MDGGWRRRKDTTLCINYHTEVFAKINCIADYLFEIFLKKINSRSLTSVVSPIVLGILGLLCLDSLKASKEDVAIRVLHMDNIDKAKTQTAMIRLIYFYFRNMA